MGVKDKMIGEKSEMLDMAVRICRGYLHGPWKKITKNDIVLKRISGGLSNYLYHVKLQKENAEPSQVLLRFYGQTHGERAIESLITDSVIFTLLSERRLGPRLHGIFPGGRIEEYIPARPLKTFELSDSVLSPMIAEKMAAVHAMNVPINKEPCWLWNTMDRWLQTIEESRQLDIFFNVVYRNHLHKIRSPVLFCHNDMQEGNILLKLTEAEQHNANEVNGNCTVAEDNNNNNCDKDIVLIDFEYCSYNYRAFDLANHFIEWTYDYTKEEHPNFSIHRDHYPTHEQMRYHDIILSYQPAYSLIPGRARTRATPVRVRASATPNKSNTGSKRFVKKARVVLCSNPNLIQADSSEVLVKKNKQPLMVFINRYLACVESKTSHGGVASELNTPEHLLMEVKHFSLASHLFWTLWGIVNAMTSQIPFGYCEYAAERLDCYFVLKSKLMKNESGVKRKVIDLD
ncbi:choline kinase alpha [Nilaparvata lugens]|uniref:choline kinase alpha n=1 Tax=Nilaparvata lugens TaxID=108931 RepID=UPI00193E386D|nr:choline kinase alpha [Nilaparvata lugens]